jgi:hypothetical protein
MGSCEAPSSHDQPLHDYIRHGELVFRSDPNEWTSAIVASDFLRWLGSRIQTGPIVALGDLIGAVRKQDFNTQTEKHATPLLFIPTGTPSEYQPLNRRIFGSSKVRPQA